MKLAALIGQTRTVQCLPGICHGEGEVAKRIMEMDTTYDVQSNAVQCSTV